MASGLIEHLDTNRVVILQANVSGRSLNEVLTEIQRVIATVQLPPGYRLTQGGEAKDGDGWASWRNRTDQLFAALFPPAEKTEPIVPSRAPGWP